MTGIIKLPALALTKFKLVQKSPLGVFIHEKRKEYKMADHSRKVRVEERLKIKIGKQFSSPRNYFIV